MWVALEERKAKEEKQDDSAQILMWGNLVESRKKKAHCLEEILYN